MNRSSGDQVGAWPGLTSSTGSPPATGTIMIRSVAFGPSMSRSAYASDRPSCDHDTRHEIGPIVSCGTTVRGWLPSASMTMIAAGPFVRSCEKYAIRVPSAENTGAVSMAGPPVSACRTVPSGWTTKMSPPSSYAMSPLRATPSGVGSWGLGCCPIAMALKSASSRARTLSRSAVLGTAPNRYLVSIGIHLSRVAQPGSWRVPRVRASATSARPSGSCMGACWSSQAVICRSKSKEELMACRLR